MTNFSPAETLTASDRAAGYNDALADIREGWVETFDPEFNRNNLVKMTGASDAYIEGYLNALEKNCN
jgi:hypothetical protein